MSDLHFENLWESAEDLSQKLSSNDSETIINEITLLLTEFTKINNISNADARKFLKIKKVGEVLFKLSDLSRLESINTFEALLMEINFQSKS